MKRRVVITGMGVVSSLANDLDTFWTSLHSGKSGISAIERWDAAAFTTRIAAEIKNWDASKWLPKKVVRQQLDPFSQYGCVAAQGALIHGGVLESLDGDPADVERWPIDGSRIDPDRFGTIIGVGMGGLFELEVQAEKLKTRGPGRVSPFLIPSIMMNAVAGQIAIRHGLCGPNFCTASACASGTHAMGLAYQAIKYDEADLMVTGATEACITPLGMSGFCSARAMSTRNEDPLHASRPFDKDRDGFVMGEGSGMLIFEELEHAKKRGATIHAEVIGYGATDDGFHITAPRPDGSGAVKAMQLAIRESGLDKERFNYINAHGTSTPLNDPMETRAIKAVFGDHAKRGMCVSSTKSMVGHILGGSGGVELVATVLGISRNGVHPTANLEHPDPECDLDCVPDLNREYTVNAALSNSFGFGGHNACVAVKRYEND